MPEIVRLSEDLLFTVISLGRKQKMSYTHVVLVSEFCMSLQLFVYVCCMCERACTMPSHVVVVSLCFTATMQNQASYNRISITNT